MMVDAGSDSPLNGVSYIWLHLINFVVWINISTSCQQWSEVDHFENSQDNLPIRSGIKNKSSFFR